MIKKYFGLLKSIVQLFYKSALALIAAIVGILGGCISLAIAVGPFLIMIWLIFEFVIK